MKKLCPQVFLRSSSTKSGGIGTSSGQDASEVGVRPLYHLHHPTWNFLDPLLELWRLYPPSINK